MQLPAKGAQCPKGHPLVLGNLTWNGTKFVCRTCAKGAQR